MISKIAVFISAFSDLSKALFLIPPTKILEIFVTSLFKGGMGAA